jgi:flagellar biosynthesis component FlhA
MESSIKLTATIVEGLATQTASLCIAEVTGRMVAKQQHYSNNGIINAITREMLYYETLFMGGNNE